MSPNEVPAGVPAVLTITHAALVAGMNPHTVRGWVDRGKLDYYQANTNDTRFIRAADLLEACTRRGIAPNWDAIPEDVAIHAM